MTFATALKKIIEELLDLCWSLGNRVSRRQQLGIARIRSCNGLCISRIEGGIHALSAAVTSLFASAARAEPMLAKKKMGMRTRVDKRMLSSLRQEPNASTAPGL